MKLKKKKKEEKNGDKLISITLILNSKYINSTSQGDSSLASNSN